MNFKTLLKIINEESRERADSFRTTGEANAKDRATASSGDYKAKDAARKRVERSKQVPRDRKSKAELLKDIVVVKTHSNRLQLIFKDSYNKNNHELVSKEGPITFEDAKKVAQDPNFEQTRASKLLLGNMKEDKKAEKKESNKEEKPKREPHEEGEKKETKKPSAEGEEEKPRRLSKEEMFTAMTQMSAEQLAMLPLDVREEYFKKQRNPPTNQDFDNTTFEGLSVQFGISPVSSLPFNQQVLNAILFLTKIKVGAGQQEMQTFAAMNPASTDFTKRAYLQATKILSQIGDECLSNLLSATEGGTKQMYTEGSVDMKCGDYRFKIEAGGEFSVSTDGLNQTNKLFKGILATALNAAFNNPEAIKRDPGIKKMLAKTTEDMMQTSNTLISAENLQIILQNPAYAEELKRMPVVLGNGTQSGTVLDADGNLNPAASLEAYLGKIEKASKHIFKKETDTEKSVVGNITANAILRAYLRGDGMKTPDQQPNHVITANGVFPLSDAYINEISKNAVLTVKPSEKPLTTDNITNIKTQAIQSLNKWKAIVEQKEDKQQKQKMPSLKELITPAASVNPMEYAANYLRTTMEFDFNASLIPGFKPNDINSVEYNYVTIGKKTTKIPVVRGDRVANQMVSEVYLMLNDLLVEALINDFVLSKLVKANLITNDEANALVEENLLLEDQTNILKDILEKMFERSLNSPLKVYIAERLLSEKYKRDYKMEYRNYHGKPKQRKERAARNKARELMMKKGKAKKGDGKDIDHKKPLRSGGTNGEKNLQKRSKSSNRSDNGHHKGEHQNKDWK